MPQPIMPNSPEDLHVLTRGDVRRCLANFDPVTVVAETLRSHARGETTLPAEAYLPWINGEGAACRSLAMPAAIGTGTDRVFGLKVINAALSNPLHGIARAGGFITLFDPETGRPRLLAEGATISALRTAAYTIVSLAALGPPDADTVTIIGCGNLARVHAELIERYRPSVRHLRLHDTRMTLAEELATWWSARRGRKASVYADAQAALVGSPVAITLTTSENPYIEPSWLDERAFIAHVSLDDITPDVFTQAQAIYVDDIGLVADNPRRILGELLADGSIGQTNGQSPSLAGTLGDVLNGTIEGIRPSSGRVISNPFGMAILDLALAREVHRHAVQSGLGVHVDLTMDLPATEMFPTLEGALR